jgi:ribonuclease P protein component
VDDSGATAESHGSADELERESAPVTGLWLGLVVPKRHARRAVTRNLLRREIRAALTARCAALPGGLWVVRLRSGFDRSRFRSAASDALRQAARVELAALFDRCVERSSAGRM